MKDFAGGAGRSTLRSLAIRVIRGFRQDQVRIARFGEQVRQVRAAELRKAKLLGRYSAVVATLPEVATACALTIGAAQVAAGRLSAGALLAFLATVIALRPTVAQTGELLAACHDAAAAADRFFDVLDVPLVAEEQNALLGSQCG